MKTMTVVNAASPTMNGESLWPRLAGLPLVIEACEYERLHAVLAYEFERYRDAAMQDLTRSEHSCSSCF